MKRKIRFGVIADLHVDIMHDAQKRLEDFLNVCRHEEVDFVIQLGDFCYPDEGRKCICQPQKRPVNIQNALDIPTFADKDAIISMYRDFEKPSYHVVGNHDCDMCSKEQILDYYGVGNSPYYSFDMGGFHFVVLDPNYYKKDGEYISYGYGNYFDESYRKDRVLPYLPPEQIDWLKRDLDGTSLPSVLFSHQCLMRGGRASVLNADELRQTLLSAPSGVVMAMYGHEHIDTSRQQDGIWFVGVNSTSNLWLGEKYVCHRRYGKEIDEKYPNIKYVAPYRDALYAIVTADENGASIKGVRSEFVGKTPKELGADARLIGSEEIFSASITDKYLEFYRIGHD